jgi:hypothetical protein
MASSAACVLSALSSQMCEYVDNVAPGLAWPRCLATSGADSPPRIMPDAQWWRRSWNLMVTPAALMVLRHR